MITNKKIIFFDGHCNLCNYFVRSIIKLDKQNTLYFAHLHGENAKILLNKLDKNTISPDSVIFYNNNNISFKSKAVIEILLSLGGCYKIFFLAKIIPSFILNIFYDIIAKYRYSWFGKRENCPAPDKKNISKFLK